MSTKLTKRSIFYFYSAIVICPLNKAISIYKPLELRLFQMEIDAKLLKMNQEKENEANQFIVQSTEFQQVETLKGEISVYPKRE